MKRFMKITILLLVFVSSLYSQDNIEQSVADSTTITDKNISQLDDSTQNTNDTSMADTTADSLETKEIETYYKIAVASVVNNDTEFASLFTEKLYNSLDVTSHIELQKKYPSLEYDLENNWYKIAILEKINYILFLNIKSPRVKCKSNTFIFFKKRLEKEVVVDISVFSIEDSAKVYTGKIEVVDVGKTMYTLKSCSNTLVDVEDMKFNYNRGYSLAIENIRVLLEQMGVYKEKMYER